MITTTTRTIPGPLGQILIAGGAIQQTDLDTALEEQRRSGDRIGAVLMRRGLDGDVVARALARQLRLPHASAPLSPEPAALELLDGALAVRLRVIPMAATERVLRVAMTDPLDVTTTEDLRFRTGRRIEPVVAAPATIDAALVAAYSAHTMNAVLTRMHGGGSAGDAEPEVVDTLRRAAETPPIIALVDLILAQASQRRASDVHIEPTAGNGMRVRARIDGILRELMVLPPQSRGAVVSRIKVMAGLDISVKRRPQDGRGAVRVQGRELALRVSTLPTHVGEKVVLRLLDSSNAGQRLDNIAMTPPVLAQFRLLLGRSHGVILVTGPTGSGKTTTLYGALGSIDRETRNVITLEDPVEYRLPGLTQVQVHRKAGLGFPAALRAVLRQDPDVIMVGELRDKETVEIALAAALTGHLVLSTLHTNDAASASARLYEMGAPSYLVAGGLLGVLAQRLARKLCVHCRAQHLTTAAEMSAHGLRARPAQVFAAVGCSRCDGTGYRGRIGIFELLTVSPQLRDRIAKRAPADTLLDTARAEGFTTMADDAWAKVRAGVTTIAEVAPLLAMASDSATCAECRAPVRGPWKACTACGASLRRSCACGAAVRHGWRHCASCGAAQP